MRKRDFDDLLNYLKTHPTDAGRLAEALSATLKTITSTTKHGNEVDDVFVGIRTKLSTGENPSEGHATATDRTVWLKAREIGSDIHQSARWVLERKHLLPPEYTKRSQSGRGKPAWLFHPESINLLNQYR